MNPRSWQERALGKPGEHCTQKKAKPVNLELCSVNYSHELSDFPVHMHMCMVPVHHSSIVLPRKTVFFFLIERERMKLEGVRLQMSP